MDDSLVEILREMELQLKRIEYALIPPEKISKEEARELEKLFSEAISGKVRNWREIESDLES